MNDLKIKGERTELQGRQKQNKASRSGDRFACLEGKEEELAGKLQQKFGDDEEEILDTIEKADDLKE